MKTRMFIPATGCRRVSGMLAHLLHRRRRRTSW